MQKTILPIISLALFGLANAQIKGDGACPNPPVQSNFDMQRYKGIWYEFSKYPASFEGNSKCATVTFTPKNQNEANILKTMINPSTNKAISILGDAQEISDSKFKVTYKATTNIPSSYWVLSTDYISYAIIYSCESAGDNSHNTYVWILTRPRRPSAAIVAKARGVLSLDGIDLTPLTLTDQNKC